MKPRPNKLKALMKKRGMPVKELAYRTGLKQTTVQHAWEGRWVRMEDAHLMATVFRMQPTDLFERIKDKNYEPNQRQHAQLMGGGY